MTDKYDKYKDFEGPDGRARCEAYRKFHAKHMAVTIAKNIVGGGNLRKGEPPRNAKHRRLIVGGMHVK